MINQPILYGKMILLRKYKVSDAKEDCKIGNDIKVSKWINEIPYPYTLNEAKKWISSTLKNKKDYYYAILLKEDKSLIGTTWINHIKNKVGELSYLIGSKYWGTGYATEAAELMISFGFGNLKLKGLLAKVNELNKGSIKILENLDFKLEKTLKNKSKIKFTDKLYDELYFVLKNKGDKKT